jgi:hypothetical protein
LGNLKRCQHGGQGFSFRGACTISVIVYAQFEFERYVAIMAINATEYNAPHSTIMRKIGTESCMSLTSVGEPTKV